MSPEDEDSHGRDLLRGLSKSTRLPKDGKQGPRGRGLDAKTPLTSHGQGGGGGDFWEPRPGSQPAVPTGVAVHVGTCPGSSDCRLPLAT